MLPQGWNCGLSHENSIRTIGILVLGTTSWPRIRQCVDLLREKVGTFKASGYEEITIP